MLKDKTIQKIKLKMVNENINQCKLARKLHCSNGALSCVLNKKKTLLKLETRIQQWLIDKEIKFEE